MNVWFEKLKKLEEIYDQRKVMTLTKPGIKQIPINILENCISEFPKFEFFNKFWPPCLKDNWAGTLIDMCSS